MRERPQAQAGQRREADAALQARGYLLGAGWPAQITKVRAPEGGSVAVRIDASESLPGVSRRGAEGPGAQGARSSEPDCATRRATETGGQTRPRGPVATYAADPEQARGILAQASELACLPGWRPSSRDLELAYRAHFVLAAIKYGGIKPVRRFQPDFRLRPHSVATTSGSGITVRSYLSPMRAATAQRTFSPQVFKTTRSEPSSAQTTTPAPAAPMSGRSSLSDNSFSLGG